MKIDKISIGVNKFLTENKTISEIKKELKLSNSRKISQRLKEMGLYLFLNATYSKIINLSKAVSEYIEDPKKLSLSKLSIKYNISRTILTKRLVNLGYSIINYQNITKFDDSVFDIIDTEEKAYWLGFIYADGYISGIQESYNFEISLKSEDKDHLYKFNKFMKHCDPNHVKISNTNYQNNGIKYKRCRWGIHNKHLWQTLNNYGCTPRKSLTLQFPDTKIFKSKDLIRHFMRGYFDGDGCISYGNKEHNKICIKILGTYAFLTELKKNLLTVTNYVLTNNKNSSNTKVLTITGKNAFKTIYYLYNNSKIYLNRKYRRYKEFCRVYKELYILLQTNNGKSQKV